MSQLQEMDAFIQIVERGGIGKAADHLGIAKSAVSRRLSELEKRVGTTLLTRTTRQSSLTEEGERFYQRSLQILGDIEELNTSTGDHNTSFTGTIRIAAPPAFGLTQLPKPLVDFMVTYPDITLAISLSNRLIDLVSDGFDVAIRIGDKEAAENANAILCPVHHVICASPGYLETNGTPTTPKELEQHKTLQYCHQSHQAIKFYGAKNRSTLAMPPIKMRANDGAILRTAALEGQGIFFAETFIVSNDIKSGKLVPILQNYTLEKHYLYAIYPQSRFVAKRVRKFIDHIQFSFNQEPMWDDGIK
ncbi:MAG: DNA-binding transcriptional LysR family regulator [Saprospiraceae bacterium]|jgi:DNA-binding transcriptional LysR family regulator